MADCFCGCGRRVRLLDRNDNKRGQELVWLTERFGEIRDRLVAADKADSALESVMPVAANVEQVEGRMERLTFLSDLCAKQVHGERDMPFEWWDEKKKLKPGVNHMRDVAAQFEGVLDLSPAELRAVAGHD